MTVHSPTGSEYPYVVDLERVWQSAVGAHQQLCELMEVAPVPAEFDEAEHFIAWVARFIPLGLGGYFEDMLRRTMRDLRARSDFKHHGWSRSFGIAVALYMMTDEQEWLEEIIGNLSHHNSWLRSHTCAMFALVADSLPFDANRFQRAMREDVERGHNLDELVVLAAATLGTADEKRELLRGWCEVARERPDNTVALLASGRAVPNPFHSKLTKVTQMAFVRLISRPPADRALPGGLESPREHLHSLAYARAAGIVAGDALWREISQHPLLQTTVEVVDRVAP